jgi:hypothetical protein
MSVGLKETVLQYGPSSSRFVVGCGAGSDMGLVRNVVPVHRYQQQRQLAIVVSAGELKTVSRAGLAGGPNRVCDIEEYVFQENCWSRRSYLRLRCRKYRFHSQDGTDDQRIAPFADQGTDLPS